MRKKRKSDHGENYLINVFIVLLEDNFISLLKKFVNEEFWLECASQKSDKHLQVDYNSVFRKLGLPFKRAQLIPGSHLYVELLQVPQWRTYSINHLTDVDALFIIHFKVTHTLVTNSLLQWSQSHSLILELFINSLDITNNVCKMDHMHLTISVF